jgi:zinc transporter
MAQEPSLALSGSVDDNLGLVCAFELDPLRPRTSDVFARQPPGRTWLHLNLSDSRARRWIEQRADLPLEAQEMFLETDNRIRVEVVPHGLIAVLGDLHHDYNGEPEGIGVLRIYLDSRRMITARSHPLRSSDVLRRQVQHGELAGATPMAVLEQYLVCLGETFAAVTAELAEETDDAEEEVLAGQFKNKGAKLGKMRRLLARLRRQVNANRSALMGILGRLPDFYNNPELRQGLRQAIEPLDAVAADLDLVQERSRLLQEEIAGRIGEATSRNLFLLSIVTTTMLPITLITGIFGMNVGGLPWVGDSGGFWWVMLVIVAAVVFVVQLLRRQRVL